MSSGAVFIGSEGQQAVELGKSYSFDRCAETAGAEMMYR
jgi:hypothetical protein